MSDVEVMDGSSTPRCGICGGPATRTEITAGGEGLTPVVLCDAEVCKPPNDGSGDTPRQKIKALIAAQVGGDAAAEVVMQRIADRLGGYTHDEAVARNPLPPASEEVDDV